MKSVLDLVTEKEALQARIEGIIGNAQKEERKLNDEETNEMTALKKLVADKNEEIRKFNEENINFLNEKKKTMKETKFSLLKAINDVANNRSLDESAQVVVNEGIAEMRKAGQSYSGQIVLPVEQREATEAIVATVATAGQEVVAEDKLNILEQLRSNLVLSKAGATYMTGLVGDVSIPVYSGSTVGWKGEIDEADNGAGKFDEITLSPKRLTAYIDISKQFLIQDSASAEQMLKNDIVKALSTKLESTILGIGAGDNTKPAGIFSDCDGFDFTKAYEGTVDMESALDNANVTGDYYYLVSPSIKAELRKAKKDAGSGSFVMENNEINGIPVLVSTCVKDGYFALGNWNEYVIAQWGGIDLTVDPYTQASKGMVRLVVNAYFDARPRRSEAIVTRSAH